ncbi:MAG: hypothetical protein [Circular genetic element sp.]|nr:MAG: hypothetical protein [Circular genetic element sp.]
MPTRLRFEFDSNGRTYIDLAKEMSKVQRKLVRQGQNFVIHGGLIQDANNEYTVRFNTAPQSWVVGTALRRARKMWETQYQQIMREGGLGKVKPKYWDWKVYLNQGHISAGGASLLEAKDEAGTAYPAGEWAYSRYASEDVDWSAAGIPQGSQNRDADEFFCHIVGDHMGNAPDWVSVGAIESWRDSRPSVDDDSPDIDVPTRDAILADPLVNLFDEADTDDERLEHLASHNDSPPYDAKVVPGTGATGLERMAMAAVSQSNPIVPFGGFVAPHGLIEVHSTRASAGLVTVLMDVEAVGGIY